MSCAADVHVLNEPDFRVNSPSEFDQISQLIVIGTTHHRCVYFCVRKSRGCDSLDTRDDLIVAITLTYRLEALGLQRIKTDSDAFHTRSLQAVNAVGEKDAVRRDR
ncbi:Uncharacterised protein [Mycobacterium tuberculosis]|nr:Uncharacterised protein [Mycobacterium tuberculosis]COW50764.1 Uncharacterised protein [Mycobacterium tuberculosis]COW57429.1 Uncharacterised protein [Mycobacterium tuberculosis]